MGPISPWQLAILVLVLVLLFGAKKLPDAARSIGRSMKIFKAETKGLREENDEDGEQSSSGSASTEARQLPQVEASATRTDETSNSSSTDEQIAQLQRQLDDMRNKADESHKNA